MAKDQGVTPKELEESIAQICTRSRVRDDEALTLIEGLGLDEALAQIEASTNG